jgi:hypothetical protein
LFSGIDQFLTHKLGVFDSDGQQVLMLERPAKLMKSKIKVSDAEGTGRGAILQDNVVGPKHFALVDRRGDRRTVPTTTVTRTSSRATGDCGTTSIWSCHPATRGRPEEKRCSVFRNGLRSTVSTAADTEADEMEEHLRGLGYIE